MSRRDLSIVVTNYNYARYLPACLESCMRQKTSADYEIIVVDDGSTDGSLDVIARYRRRLAGMMLLTLSRKGVEAAANTGIRAAAGEFIVRVDADDFLLPGFVDAMVTMMRRTHAAFAYSDYFEVDGDGRRLKTVLLPEFDCGEIAARGDFLATGTVFRRHIFQAMGGYEETVKNCGLENYHLMLRLLKKGLYGEHVSKPLFAYRRHGANLSVKRRKAIVDYGRMICTGLGYGRYRTNDNHPYGLEVSHE